MSAVPAGNECDFGEGSGQSSASALTKLGGWVLIADGVTAWYLGCALAVNPLMPEGRQLPTWPYPYARESESTTTVAIPPRPRRRPEAAQMSTQP
jgi:hypothetical protein